MTVLMIPKNTAQTLRDLTGESRPDVALMLVMQDARSYRLQQIDAALRVFEEKYGMAFEEYRQQWETNDREADYQWAVEQDFLSSTLYIYKLITDRRKQVFDVFRADKSQISRRRSCLKNALLPKSPAHECQDVVEGGVRFRIPGGLRQR